MQELTTAGLDGKVVMITGGASGLGLAAARQLVNSGARVMITDRHRDMLQGAFESLRVGADQVLCAPVDVTDAAALVAAVGQCVETWGQLDGAFNSAGVSGPFNVPLLDLEVAEWQNIIDINMTGVWYSMRAQVAAMNKSGRGGSIVNAASVAGLIGSRVNNAYSASKFAVVGMSKSVAMEYGTQGIRVNAICPGWIETPMTEMASGNPEFQAATAARHALGRTGQPGEVGALVAWLISDHASFMSGAAIPVDGGMTAG